jgi:hypothetical protein
MKYLKILFFSIFFILNCSEEEPPSPDRLDIIYEVTGNNGSIEITYLFNHFYLDTLTNIPWKVSFTPGGITTSVGNPSGIYTYEKDQIVYIYARRIDDDFEGEIQTITATIFVNNEIYKTETAQGYNVSVKVGGWYGL